MRKREIFKKGLTVVLTAAMAFGVPIAVGRDTKVAKAETATIDNIIMINDDVATGSDHTKGFKITKRGFKLTFKSKMITEKDWDSPQFSVYKANDDTYANVSTDVNANALFIGRSDNYAWDSTGNRWAEKITTNDDETETITGSPLANKNSYAFTGTFTRDGNEVESDYTIEAYLVGDSAIVIMGNETFSCVSRIAVDSSDNNYLSLIANYCDVTDIEYKDKNYDYTRISDVATGAYAAKLSSDITVDTEGVLVSFISTSTGTANYNGACVFGYNNKVQCVAITTDCRLNSDANSNGGLGGYTATISPSWGGAWKTYNENRKPNGTGCFVYAKLVGSNLNIFFGNNTFGSYTTVSGIDTTKSVTLKLTGDASSETNIYVSSSRTDITDTSIPNSIGMVKGQKKTITPAYTPNNGSPFDVSWESSDEGVVTVDEEGVVTAVEAGTCNLTMTARDSSGKQYTKSSSVTVITEDSAIENTSDYVAKTSKLVDEDFSNYSVEDAIAVITHLV